MVYVVATLACIAIALLSVPGMLAGSTFATFVFTICAMCALINAGLSINVLRRSL